MFDLVPWIVSEVVGRGHCVALWLMAQLIGMPMMGGGLLGSAMGGMMAVMGSRASHTPDVT
jgi:hypothetical protein